MVGQTVFFSLGEATSLGEGKLLIQTCQTSLRFDLLSYPARAEVLVNIDMNLLNRQIERIFERII